MSAARGVGRWITIPLAAVLVLGAGQALAQTPSPSDSLLREYVRTMSDSTDVLYGVTATPVDTAGLDSALAFGLTRPHHGHGFSEDGPAHRGVHFDWSPALGFNRVDGGQLGAGLTLRTPLPGKVEGRLQYTTGTHDWLGEGGWGKTWALKRFHTLLVFRGAGGRWTEAFDRDHYDPVLTTIRAVTDGSDRHQYLRRDGFITSLRLSGEQGYARVGWRDQLESSLPFTTDWTLFGGDPELEFNSPATSGSAHELALEGDVTVPGTRFRVNAAYWTSDPHMGSDFLYRRSRYTIGGDLSLGRHFALVPQATYARLRGQALPQQALPLGGPYSLRTIERGAQTGTGNAYSRVDLILADDLHALLHLPLPAWLPLQAGVFGATGAVWGQDPVSGAAVATDQDWPHRNEWLSEVGGGLSWRAGVPDPTVLLRVEYTVPIGADAREARWTAFYQRAVNLLPAR